MKIIFLAASLAALGLGSPSSAEPVTARLSISTAGLDLATPAGQRALDRRILHAASALCGTPSPADGRGRAAYDQCRADARVTAAAERNRAIEVARRQGGVAVAANR